MFFDKPKTIEMRVPSGEKCLAWEYALGDEKKIVIDASDTVKPLLYDASARRFIDPTGVVKLEKGRKYRLFGVMRDFSNLFRGGDEFRAVSLAEYRFVFAGGDGKDVPFVAKVRADGTFSFTLLRADQFVRAHLNDISPEAPIYADYTDGREGFNFRTYFHEKVKPQILLIIENALAARQKNGAISVDAFPVIVAEANAQAQSVNDGLGEWFNVRYEVKNLLAIGDTYRDLVENFNQRALNLSAVETLESEAAARKAAAAVEDLT